MKISDIRNWLGLYFFLISGILGGYLLIFAETGLLPISRQEAISAFEIIIPVLFGQLTIIFKWYGSDQKSNKDDYIDMPKWVVKGPPIMIAIILVFAIGNLIVGNLGEGQGWALSPDSFKYIITFCLSILNATTIFIILRFFKIEHE